MAWKTEKKSTELCRLLSKRGITSRKIATQWIEEGKVKVNGKRITQADKWVSLDSDIEIKDSNISDEKSNSEVKTEVYLLNKKRGWVTTRSDEKDRDTVYSNPTLASKWLIPVGRLDQASEGLLLFTNDTQLSHQLCSPETHLTKIYHVQTTGKPNPEVLAKLEAGVSIDGYLTQGSKWKIIRTGKKNSWLEVHLTEGRNRQIRKMLESFGMNVLRLIRIQIGDLELGDLAKGECRPLSQSEIASLKII